ncbi:hydrophobin [Gautieria morchelliformis]|nr:hydrophobin [Gautieria morchelliformis]
MMFTKAFVFSTLAIFSAAAPNPWNTVTVTAPASAGTTISQCNTGSAQCCNTVGAANSLPGAAVLMGLLGIVLQDVSAVIGLGCTPISVIGVAGGVNCDQQPVCCTNNNFNGLVNVGCSPIAL